MATNLRASLQRSRSWDALKAAADEEGVPVSRLIARIDAARTGCGLSSAIRVWLLARYRKGAT